MPIDKVETTETIEEQGQTEELDDNETMWRDFAESARNDDQKAEGSEGDEEVAETETETETGEEVETGTETETETEVAPEYLFEVDGKGVTAEEAKKGYMLQSDYSRKMTEASKDKQVVEQNKAVLDIIAANPKAQEYILNLARGEDVETEAPPTKVAQLEVPENYNNDPFVTNTVNAFNAMREELAEMKSGFTAIKSTTAEREQKEREQQELSLLRNRLETGYGWLTDKGVTLTREEYGNRVQAFFEEAGLQPPVFTAYITGADERYLVDKLPTIFAEDIAQKKTDKDNSDAGKKKAQAKKANVLRASGKSKSTGAPSLPRKPDGSLDSDELLRNIVSAGDEG